MARPKLSDGDLRAWRAVLRAQAAAVRRINASLTDSGGLALESYDVLLELYHAPGRRLRLGELGERVVLTRSGISRLVSRLEREGLVEREAVDGDGRGVVAHLTREGVRRFRATWPLYARGIDEHFARHLRRGDAARVASALERVVDAAADGPGDQRTGRGS